MKANWHKRTLQFYQPAGTSRGIMSTRDVWYITLRENGVTGIGECAPLPGLSLDDIPQIETMLEKVCDEPITYIHNLDILVDFPSIRFGLEMADLDLKNSGGQSYYPVSKSAEIHINGLIWMGDSNYLLKQTETKLDEKWKCIKLKIGALDFHSELDMLSTIRERFNQDQLELRVDANGAFSKKDVFKKLDRLSAFDIHSIEQPVAAGQWDLMEKLCKLSPIPIALDEELIPLTDEKSRIEILEQIKPNYIVLKPSLLGGFSETEKWIALAEERQIGWWVTSALESNIGLNALYQWTSKIKPKGFQGLGTGKLFVNNTPSSLTIKQGTLTRSSSSIWKDIHTLTSEWMNDEKQMVFHTSGSTGSPKKIEVNKRNIKNSIELTRKSFGLEEGDTALLCLPVNYIAGKMMVIRSLDIGMNLIVSDPSSSPLRDVEEQIGFAAMVPLQLENSIEDLSKVKTLLIGGAKVDESLINRLQSVSTQIYETYGMTETLTHVAIKPLNGKDRAEVFQALEGVLFGQDERGCLVIYAPDLNPEPVITNDIVELFNACSFKWLGRYDRVINSGGIKIIPETVEEKLRSVISKRRFFVSGMKDNVLGEKVVLVVEGDQIDISFDHLDQYEKPKETIFAKDFAETHTGKVDRNKTMELIKN